MNISTNRIIFSTERASSTREVNQLNHAKAKRDLENFGLTYLEIEGFYKGIPEASFMVFHSNTKVENLVRELAKEFKQESVLHIDSNNQAYLEFFNGDQNMEVGHWNEVSKEYATAQKAHSVIQGRYFLAE